MENVWKKLKTLKPLFKRLNADEYKGITKRIEDARSDLVTVQEKMQSQYSDSLLEQEKQTLQQLEKWSLIEEKRSHRKQILKLITEDERKVNSQNNIKEECIRFYKNLMGTSTNTLPAINKEIIKNGPKITHEQQLNLIAEVTEHEVYKGLCAIQEDKAPRVDGYNSCFFKKAWPILKQEIVQAVQKFFITGRMYKEWIFLEQVMIELGFPSKFQKWVLACMKTVTYSIIINGEPTEPFQVAKGLRQRDSMSPFLFAIAMEYWSRGLNGLKKEREFKYHPKCAKLGITHLSFADDLLLFARASGLKANQETSSIFFGGVDQLANEEIVHKFGYSRGTLPVKYLEVPLTTKKMSIAQWQPLIEKMVAVISSWTAKKLSYAGRIQLVQSVAFGIQAY
uniref:Uncharacterized protein LOC104245256 n=1 Tax=Nicotiana sylvestris TaxID=4096 RepID=A0A1U7Y4V1_NICSY|nr:PREDICTED: uncharacterized protein LOC104245256 [Nicotiana sylvestris]